MAIFIERYLDDSYMDHPYVPFDTEHGLCHPYLNSIRNVVSKKERDTLCVCVYECKIIHPGLCICISVFFFLEGRGDSTLSYL